MRMFRGVIRVLNVMLAGILAGVSFGIWMGFNPRSLSSSTYVEQQQNMLHGLRGPMVAVVVVVTVITLASSLLQKSNKLVFYGLLAAAGFFVTCILITALGNKPIDEMVLTWNAVSPPRNWTELRDKWWTLHILRTIVELAGFLLVVWTGVRKD